MSATPLLLLWISLDGLQLPLLEKALLQPGPWHPQGLHHLLHVSQREAALPVSEPTITASSHISQITCSPPGVHGIYENRTYTGSGFENSFLASYQAQSYPAFLKSRGIAAASIFYPGTLGDKESQAGTLGAQFHNTIEETEELVCDGKRTLGRGNSFFSCTTNDAKSISLVIRKGEVTEKILLPLKTSQFVPLSQNPLGGVQVWPSDAGHALVSPLSQNHGYPKTFQQDLDALNQVFPTLKTPRLQQQFGLNALAEALGLRTRYTTQVAKKALQVGKPRALFVYFEALDTLGHGGIFDAHDHTFVNTVRALDEAVGQLIEASGPQAGVVVVGDHGMAPAQTEVNVFPLLPPLERKKYVVSTSGGAMFFYAQNRLPREAPSLAEQKELSLLAAHLAQATLPGTPQPVFAKIITRETKEAREAGLQGPLMPWLIAFANTGISLKTSVENKVILASRQRGDVLIPAGVHGFAAAEPAMKTGLLLRLPQRVVLPKSAHMLLSVVAPAVGLPVWPHCLLK